MTQSAWTMPEVPMTRRIARIKVLAEKLIVAAEIKAYRDVRTLERMVRHHAKLRGVQPAAQEDSDG